MITARLNRENWLKEARKVLVSSGVDQVKIVLLARRLKVTRGSFYWHFKHRQELLEALVSDWETTNRPELEAVAARIGRHSEGIVELFRIWLGVDPSYPTSIWPFAPGGTDHRKSHGLFTRLTTPELSF